MAKLGRLLYKVRQIYSKIPEASRKIVGPQTEERSYRSDLCSIFNLNIVGKKRVAGLSLEMRRKLRCYLPHLIVVFFHLPDERQTVFSSPTLANPLSQV